MSTQTSPPPSVPAEAPKRKRGRENVRDMVLSLAVCVAVVVPIWFLQQPPPSDGPAIQVVDPSGDIADFREAAPGVPVPGALPDGWRPTSSRFEDGRLRIGYVTPGEEYAEFAAQVGPPGTFVEDQTGRGAEGARLTVGGRSFTVYSDDDAHTSLVQQQPAGTVVVGGLRETAEDDELTELAGLLR